MKITILCVGKLKESFYRDAVNEYRKRLSAYCRTEVIEVADEMTRDGAGAALEEQVRKREGERLLSRISQDAFVITLEIAGKKDGFPAVFRFAAKDRDRGKKPYPVCDWRFPWAPPVCQPEGGSKTQLFGSDLPPPVNAGHSL